MTTFQLKFSLNLCFSFCLITFLSQDAFTAFHLNKAQPTKYLNSLLIGELAHDQPSSEPSKNVSVGKTSELGCRYISILLEKYSAEKIKIIILFYVTDCTQEIRNLCPLTATVSTMSDTRDHN